MAYNLGARFPPPPKYITLLDPGAYSYSDKSKTKQNAAPFLSKTPRKVEEGAKLWTQAVYDQRMPSHIPNCSSMLSKKPRFPYEAFSAKDLEEILCKCGIITCECPTGEEKEEDVICRGKVRGRLIKGNALRSAHGDDGSVGLPRKMKNKYPPFYNTRVIESTAIYQGCKWSKRTSRDRKHVEATPGPADYYLVREPTQFEICAEKVRAFKRKTTRQLRFMEMVEQKNLLENRPGPAAYNPMLPKCTDLKFIGPKAERFPKTHYEIHPGPADHWLRRDFDPIKPPDKLCHAILPQQPSCFGFKANRFKTQCEEGPSPATYKVNFSSKFKYCRNAPFGSSAERFKKEIVEESDDDEIIEPLDKERKEPSCITPTWGFKSKTIRIKPLVKKYDEPSPADILDTRINTKKQSAVPFSSSESRFMPWYSWIPVHGFLDTPGPGYYCTEKPKFISAFKRGPLYRSRRFPIICQKSPPPNEYQVNNGIETILGTHNIRLKSNIKDPFKFKYQREEPKVLTLKDRERILFSKCISLLNTEDTELPKIVEEDVAVAPKQKMLRCFLYAYPVPNPI